MSRQFFIQLSDTKTIKVHIAELRFWIFITKLCESTASRSVERAELGGVHVCKLWMSRL